MLELAQTEALVNTADIEDLVDPGFCRWRPRVFLVSITQGQFPSGG